MHPTPALPEPCAARTGGHRLVVLAIRPPPTVRRLKRPHGWIKPHYGHFALKYPRLRYPSMSLCNKENSNIIAPIERSYKGQTVVCPLYGKRCCLLSCLYSATAALRARYRGATRDGHAVR